jgi:hypothetical protein
MSNQIRCRNIVAVILLMVAVQVGMYYISPLSGQTDGESNSASQNYQDFQSCLSNAEANGYASDQQVSDCFDQSYGTGTSSSSSSSSSDAGSNDESDSTGSD